VQQRSINHFWKNLRFTEDSFETDSFMALPVIRGEIAVDLEIFI